METIQGQQRNPMTQIGYLMHSDFIQTMVLKHPITPEKKLKAERMPLAAFDVSQTGLISLYEGAVVALKDGFTGFMATEMRNKMKAMMQRQHEHGIRSFTFFKKSEQLQSLVRP